ncbi:MAG: hypothetical protein HGA86_04390 [Anaerolineaceae bacterium]|nr:hypothetical protein [Anaerolineaceae bacterium]
MNRLKPTLIVVLLLGFSVLLAACASLAKPTPTETEAAPGDLQCPSDFCRKSALPEDVLKGCAAVTSRKLDDFRALTLDMNLSQVCALVGVPDWDAGSGLMIEVYDLDDGTRILIGFGGPDEMMYVHHLLKDGKSETILSR